MTLQPVLFSLGVMALLAVPAGAAPQAPEAPQAPGRVEGPVQPPLPTLAFKRFVSGIDTGEVLGQRTMGTFRMDGGKIHWDYALNALLRSKFEKHVEKEIKAAGMPVPKKSEGVFDTGEKPEEAGLELGVRLQKMELNLHQTYDKCRGGVTLEAKWALYNPKAKAVVGEFKATGTFQSLNDAVPLGDLLQGGVVALTKDLLAQEAFRKAMALPLEGPPPTPAASSHAFPSQALPKGGTVKNATLLRSAVVTVETITGTGSGFYISQDGYLLTNQHVVKGAKMVTVKTATGRELPGEVMGADMGRDVALVKTAKVPFDPLPLRLSDPKVGEDVFAIGSPGGDQFNGTLTRGVLSGFRDLKEGRFLQSDVSVMAGSSGGPLLDADGAVVGITQGGIAARGGSLNFFIPIAEALAKLSVEIKPIETRP